MSSPSSFGKTPEQSFTGLRRKDSKHALTTCHGMTSNGRPCRRPLANKGFGNSPRYTIKGTIIVPHKDQDPAVFLCWQHKEQVDQFTLANAETVDVEERTSLDTVFRNLGLEEVEEEEQAEFQDLSASTPSRPPRKAKQDLEHGKGRPQKKRPKPVQVNLTSNTAKGRYEKKSSRGREISPKSQSGFLQSLLGCFANLDLHDEQTSPPKRVRYEEPSRQSKNSLNSTASRRQQPITPPKKTSPARQGQPGENRIAKKELRKPNTSNDQSQRRDSLSPRKPPAIKVYRDDGSHIVSSAIPSYKRMPVSQPDFRHPLVEKKPVNSRAKSAPASNQSQEWMPQISPNPTDAIRIAYAKLLTAMSEPPTKSDDSGYIYMFWQTDLEQTADESDAAASIVGTPSFLNVESEEKILQRRFFRKQSVSSALSVEQRTLFLKIGRAGNVHQRMSQWQKQCKYNISLLRYYPQGQKDVTKVSCVGKVERLIHLHLEMLGKRVKRQCRCGTEHKEWFEIEATAKDVREVNDIITQWIAWSIRKYG
jgi:T5orf172 domain